MLKSILPFVIAAGLLISCSQTGSDKSDSIGSTLSKNDSEKIMATFLKTEDAWNSGDLDAFMEGYWRSEKLVFTGVGGPTYGYDATLSRYKNSYPDIETMGKLKFNVLDLYRIDESTALMIGKFYLSRQMGDLVGHYTLVWQKIEGKWLIISDHSSGQELE